MHYQSDGTQVNTRPAPRAVTGTPGWVTAGDAIGTVQPSIDDPDVMNMLLDELAAVCAAANIALDKANNAQVLQAILALIAAHPPAGTPGPKGPEGPEGPEGPPGPSGGSLAAHGDWHQMYYTPAAGQTYTNLLTLNTSVSGVLHVHGAVNLSAEPQGAICSHGIYIDGNGGPEDQTSCSQSHSMSLVVPAGSHSIQTNYSVSTQVTGAFVPVGHVLSFLFVPN